jgi:type III restriction enzyme
MSIQIQRSADPRMSQNATQCFVFGAAVDTVCGEGLPQRVKFHLTDSVFHEKRVKKPSVYGRLGVNAMAARKHLYDHILYDSENEKTPKKSTLRVMLRFTKGSIETMELRAIEEAKIHCAREHFRAISSSAITRSSPLHPNFQYPQNVSHYK